VSEGCVYISRDIVFDETVYPFSKLNPNAGTNLRKEISLLSPVVFGGVCLMDDLYLVNASNNCSENAGEGCRITGEENFELNGEEAG
jgi:hypothetical protein